MPGRAVSGHSRSGTAAEKFVPAGIHRTVSRGRWPKAATKFLESLNLEQQASCRFGLESEQWYSWSNFHSFLFRHGMCFEDMDEKQRELAFDIMRHSLSEQGFETARNIMKLNHHLGEMCERFDAFDEWYFWMSIMGNPSTTEPWGWQIDGHHLIINCLVIGDQLVLSPTFLGSEPNSANWGKYAGTRVLKEEEELGHAVMGSLSDEQRAVATIGTDLPFDVIATSFRDNLVLDYEGAPCRDFTDAQKAKLTDLLRHYAMRDHPGHSELRLDQILPYMDETHFAWIGAFDDTSPFYYRVHSPVVLIEFDHQPGVALANDDHTRWHSHTLVRTPNGNDYGKALLRQYYDKASRVQPGPEYSDTSSKTPASDPREDLKRGL